VVPSVKLDPLLVSRVYRSCLNSDMVIITSDAPTDRVDLIATFSVVAK
jgi:hypothetical protein